MLLLLCFELFFRLDPAVVLTLETSEVSATFVFTTKTTQPRPQVFSVNGALACSLTAVKRSSMRNALVPGPGRGNFPREILIETIAETGV